MRKYTKKYNMQAYSGDDHIMTTDNSELEIDEDNVFYTQLHNTYGYNSSSETSM